MSKSQSKRQKLKSQGAIRNARAHQNMLHGQMHVHCASGFLDCCRSSTEVLNEFLAIEKKIVRIAGADSKIRIEPVLVASTELFPLEDQVAALGKARGVFIDRNGIDRLRHLIRHHPTFARTFGNLPKRSYAIHDVDLNIVPAKDLGAFRIKLFARRRRPCTIVESVSALLQSWPTLSLEEFHVAFLAEYVSHGEHLADESFYLTEMAETRRACSRLSLYSMNERVLADNGANCLVFLALPARFSRNEAK